MVSEGEGDARRAGQQARVVGGRTCVMVLEGEGVPWVSNMKELRPGSAGRSEIRMLFVFDPWRQAVVLVAGDKRDSWRSWYRHAIPLAERRYGRHLEESER